MRAVTGGAGRADLNRARPTRELISGVPAVISAPPPLPPPSRAAAPAGVTVPARVVRVVAHVGRRETSPLLWLSVALFVARFGDQEQH